MGTMHAAKLETSKSLQALWDFIKGSSRPVSGADIYDAVRILNPGTNVSAINKNLLRMGDPRIIDGHWGETTANKRRTFFYFVRLRKPEERLPEHREQDVQPNLF
jgi:hypothetical protein